MQDLIEFFSNQGILVQPDALEWVAEKSDPKTYLKHLFQNVKDMPLFVTRGDLERLADTAGPIPEQKVQIAAAQQAVVAVHETQAAVAAEETQACQLEPATYDGAESAVGTLSMQQPASPSAAPAPIRAAAPMESIEILDDITNNSCGEGEIKDFIRCFNDRFDTLKKILKGRNELGGSLPLSYANERGGDVRTIGIVYDVKTTARGHILIELEDETGRAPVLIPQSNPALMELGSTLLRDEVIGVVGRMNKDLIIADDVLRPEIPCVEGGINSGRSGIREPLCAAFISDIHIGSNTFLHDEWNRFIGWLNGEVGDEKQRDLASRLKYLVLAGDVIDGIGIYPGQDEELEIDDVYGQYEALAHELARIPRHITILMAPGNHDAVRLAEPQPAFPESISKLFTSNVRFIGNPCYFAIHGIKVLAYHGRSIDDLVATIPGLTHSKPIDVMVEMLKRRHLAPIYGLRTALAPEERDYMVIRDVPDIFVTGHVHGWDVKKYRGILLINASTWQSQTSFQKMLGFEPDPAKVTVVDLQTMQPHSLSFMTEESQ